VSDWDWIHWSGVSEEFAEALSADGTLRWQAPLSDFVLDLPDTWQEFRSGLKRNIRESIRHCYNSLKRDSLEFKLQVAQHPDTVKDALERFFALHTLRALAQHEMGAVRRSGSALVLTRTGRLMADDSAVRWHIGTAALIGPDDAPDRNSPRFRHSDRRWILFRSFDPGARPRLGG